MAQMQEHLDLSCVTVTGRTLGENIAGAKVYNDRRHPPAVEPNLRRGLARGAEAATSRRMAA
jgi:dihydroxyacid dehydratase/phosphogluconate dehydratase